MTLPKPIGFVSKTVQANNVTASHSEVEGSVSHIVGDGSPVPVIQPPAANNVRRSLASPSEVKFSHITLAEQTSLRISFTAADSFTCPEGQT